MSIFMFSLVAHALVWMDNPPLAFDTGAESSITVDDANTGFATLTMANCSGDENIMGPADMDLVDAPTVYGPDGTCTVALDHSGTLTVIGTGVGISGDFTVALDLPDLTFDCGVGISGGPNQNDPDSYVVELLAAGWTTETELGIVAGTHVTYDSSWTHHDTVKDRVLAGAAIYADLDDDGRVGAVERAAGPVCTRVVN
ncbi:MAG: hypothetical protein ACI8PZ_000797 [Myxococcota bacterium]|jgi:hypothetical protein